LKKAARTAASVGAVQRSELAAGRAPERNDTASGAIKALGSFRNEGAEEKIDCGVVALAQDMVKRR
jgi:hypothetical protein